MDQLNSFVRHLGLFLAMLSLASCASFLESNDADKLKTNQEFDSQIKVERIKPKAPKTSEEDQSAAKAELVVVDGKLEFASGTEATDTPAGPRLEKPESAQDGAARSSLPPVAVSEKTDSKPKQQMAAGTGSPSVTIKREPVFEDTEAMMGRRPVVDPFRVGEKVTLALTYFNVAAGYLTLETRDFVNVNGRKAYDFVITAKSSSVFSMFYKVEDIGETFLDYETLKPFSYQLTVRESKQLKDVRTVFDWKKKKATHWEKRVTDKKGVEERHKKWKIEDYAQNVVSAAFYMRVFKMTPGKKLEFAVADQGSNLRFTGEVLRREELKTDIGVLKTIVIKPQISVGGVFKQVGDIYFWLTDDEHRYIVRFESKIRIGTIVGKLVSIE